jgi:hypothetical protein
MRKEAEMNDSDLDDIFAEARGATAAPSSDLMARILADAEAHQPAAAVLVRAAPPPRQGLWAAMLAAIGGGAALAGLSTATLAGLWIGFAQPTTLLDVTDAFLPVVTLESVDLLPSFDTILTEG